MPRRLAALSLGVVAALVAGGGASRAQTAAQWVVTGRAALDSGRHDDAVRAFERAIRLEPNAAAHRVYLAQALGAVASRANILRQPLLARRIKSELDRAVQLDPGNIDARTGLLQYYLRAPAIAGGGEPKARAMAAEISALSALRGHFARAQIAQHNRLPDAAEREYRAALAAAPDSSVAYTVLAGFLHSRQRTDEARAVLAQLLARQPDDPAGLRALRRLGETGRDRHR